MCYNQLKQSVESSVIVLKSGSKDIDTTIAYFFFKDSISFQCCWIFQFCIHDREEYEMR